MGIIDDKEIDIFISSKIGSFKHIKYHTDSTKNNKKCIENLIEVKSLQKGDAITCMAWADNDQHDILFGKKNQQIQTYSTQSNTFTNVEVNLPPGDIVGLARHKRKYIAAVSSGVVKIWSKKEETEVEVGKLDRMRICDDDGTLFATGGDENDLKIWLIGETTPIFIAKNLPHDWLQLRRPVWVSDLTFLPGEGGALVAACSRHGYIRLYDIRAQRRPVSNVDFTMAATCIAPSFDSRRVLVGFGRGQIHQVDFRTSRPDKGYKGCVGAVTALAAVTCGDRRVVSVSLDRQVRVHQFDSKELVYKQYLTSKLSCLLIQDKNSTPLRNVPDIEVKEEVEKKEVVVGGEEEMDELFDDMEVVGIKPKKKKTEEEIEVKPSAQGSTEIDLTQTEDAIKKLLKSTEKHKKKVDKRKKEKKAKSLFHNA